MSIKVIKPGLLTTVQDLGRYGYQQHGVVVSGAMDHFALRAANLLLGNPEGAAGLEMTVTGPSLEWQEQAWISICGSGLSPYINGAPIPMWRPVFIKKGSVLSFRSAAEGCRSYLTVRGGIKAASVMGSASTYLRGRIGGLEGRALSAGDVLEFQKESHKIEDFKDQDNIQPVSQEFASTAWYAGGELLPNYTLNPLIRIIQGREYDLFTKESQQALFNEEYTVSSQSDRMGYKLTGFSMKLKEPYDMISEAVTAGTVQVPPEGNLILLQADRQTTGGYPRIAQVATVDIPLMAQVKPGGKVRFAEISHREAEELYLQREQEMRMLKQGVMLKWKV
jgi:antagonist of KipI